MDSIKWDNEVDLCPEISYEERISYKAYIREKINEGMGDVKNSDTLSISELIKETDKW